MVRVQLLQTELASSPPKKKESSLHLIEGSTFLDCGVTYGDLLGGAMNLVNMRLGHLQVNLGKLFAIEAVRLLSEYSGGGLTDNHKKALAGLILIICESARMISHFDTVINGWPRAGGKSISRQQVHYVWNWGNMSRFLTGRSRCLQDEERLRQSCGITTEELALGIVHLLLNSPQPPYPTAAGQGQAKPPQPGACGEDGPSGPGNPQQTPPSTASQGGRGHLQQQKSSSASHGGRGHHQQQKQKQLSGTGRHGQPLVEVFSVRANFPVVGTIAVFDGKRGQIIYDSENDLRQAEAPGHGGKDDLVDLVLSGPSRVISADGGSFAIKFDPCESDSDDSIIQLDKDNNLWELECIANDDEYCVLESSITTGLGRTAEVTYAVLNNAVEATIEATLFLSGGTTQGTTHIDGKISAHIPLFSHDDSASVLLFSKAKGKKTDPEIRDARSIPIPLARSVVAMPLCSSLTIKVSLHATTLMHDEEGSTSTSGDASTSTTPAEDHFEHSFDMHLGETCSLSVEGVGKLCICLDIPCSEYKEGTISKETHGTDQKRGNKEGKGNKWIGGTRRMVDRLVDRVKNMMIKS